jgi:hypothetical protein
MKMQPVNSSTIAEIGYDPATCSLDVTFKSGGTWRYFAVTPEDYEQLMLSDSKGSFFARSIKKVYRGVDRKTLIETPSGSLSKEATTS